MFACTCRAVHGVVLRALIGTRLVFISGRYDQVRI
jgi:hypothetical protein